MFGGVVDIARGVGFWSLWSALAWEDIKTTYRRSIFGVAWVTLSFLAFIFVKILIFTPFMGGDNAEYFTVYLTLGFLIWQFITQLVISAPVVFLQAESWIKNDPLPFSLFVFQSMSRATFNFLLTCIVAVIVLVWYQWPVTPMALMAIPATISTLFNAIWVYLLLGVICTRHRDFSHLVQTVMRFMFFLTPIFWLPEALGPLMEYLWWNPFAHFIWIFRSPILDGDIAMVSWIYVGYVTLIGWTVTLFVFTRYRQRIVYWF